MADGATKPGWRRADGKRQATDSVPIEVKLRAGASVMQDMTAWSSIDESFREFHSLSGSLPGRVDEFVTKQGNLMFTFVTDECPELKAADQRLHEMREKLVGGRIRDTTNTEDPAYVVIASLEERLRVLVQRVMKLKKTCMEYHMDVEECRAHARALLATQAQLRKTARGALHRNSILAAAAECLSARVNACPSGDWLSQPLKCVRSARGAAPTNAACAVEGGAAPSSVSAPNRLTRPRASKDSVVTARSGDVSTSTAASLLPAVPSAEKAGLQSDDSACVAENKYRAEIDLLEKELQRTRRMRQRLSSQAASKVSRRGTLEEFFLLCMHDFKTALRGGQVDQPVLTQRPDRRDATLSKSILRAVAHSNEIQDLLFESIFPHRQPSYRRSGWTPVRGDESELLRPRESEKVL